MRCYVIIPIALEVNQAFVIFDEFYLRCPQTGNCFKTKTDKTFASNYCEDSQGEICSSGILREFNTLKEARDYVHTEITK